MREILQQLPLTDIVHKALAEHTGDLGELLRAIICAETGDLPQAASKISQLGISADAYRDAQLTSYSWAAKIHTAA
jgi:c-di-GMP-related signal transduction protein